MGLETTQRARGMTRRAALLALPLLAAACSSEPPKRTNFPALRYDFLTPLRLNVATVEVQTRYLPRSAANVDPTAPVRPEDALRQMAEDRLVAAGSVGRAMFVIDDASIIRNGNALFGSFAVHLDLGGDETRGTGYAEARVSRSISGLSRDTDIGAAIYDMTRQMMDDMNVELEFQVRRSMRDWLQTPTTQRLNPPERVQQESLPGGNPAAPATPGVTTPGAAAPGATPTPLSAPSLLAPQLAPPQLSPQPGVLAPPQPQPLLLTPRGY